MTVDLKHTRRATRLFFLAFGLVFSSWAPMVPFVKTKLAVDDGELGLILLLFGMGALVSMPLTGFFIQQFGMRLISLISALIALIVLPFLAITDKVVTVSITLFCFGFTTGIWNVAINAQAVAVESKAGTPYMSGFHSLFSVGGLCGALMISIFLEGSFSLLSSALVISSITFLIVLLQWQNLLSKNEDKKSSSPHQKFSFPELKALFLGLICFISFMAEGSMLDWSAEFLRSVLAYDPANAGIGFAIFSIAMAIGRFYGDRIIHLMGNQWVFQMGCFLAAIGFVVVVFLDWGYTGLLGFLLIGLGASNIVPILFSSVGRLQASSSFNLTIVTTCGYLGMLLGPAFIGFIANATTLSFAFLCLSILLISIGSTSRYIPKAS